MLSEHDVICTVRDEIFNESYSLMRKVHDLKKDALDTGPYIYYEIVGEDEFDKTVRNLTSTVAALNELKIEFVKRKWPVKLVAQDL